LGTRHRRSYKRSDLFLLRMWSEEVDESHAPGEGQTEMRWRGRVQRVVDGESHQFHDWQDLLNLLALMLSDTEEQHASHAEDDTRR